MTDAPTKEEVIEQCKAACNLCNLGRPTRMRIDTKEFVHDYANGPGFSHSYCAATEIRTKYQDILNG